MLSIILTTVIFALLLYNLFLWATKNDDYFGKRGIRHMKPVPIIGNNFGAFLGKYTVPEFAMHMHEQLPGEKVFGFFDFRTPVYFVRDLGVIKRVAIKDFDYFEDRSSHINESLDQLFGNSLFLMRGKKWRHMRSTLSPAFTGSKMRQMFELVSECAHDLESYLLNEAKSGEPIIWEMKELFARYSNDCIASCAFGLKVNSLVDAQNDFFRIGSKALVFSGAKAVCKFLLMRTVPSIMRSLNIQIADGRIIRFFRSMVMTTMDVRQNESISRPDMINILMKHQSNQKLGKAGVAGCVDAQRQWSDMELVAQCFLFFLAGFETVSSQLTFLMHELMFNKQVQNRLYEEVVATEQMLNGARIDFDTLQKMKYMDQVISEVLRKWPPTPVLDRQCVKDYVYSEENGFRLSIEKGRDIIIPVYAMHHNPEYFPDPDEFDPERFNDVNRQKIVPNSYIPFGIGPRNCIGSRFALMEMKVVVYYLILNFSLEPTAKTQSPLILKKNPFTLIAEQGVYIELKPRSAVSTD